MENYYPKDAQIQIHTHVNKCTQIQIRLRAWQNIAKILQQQKMQTETNDKLHEITKKHKYPFLKQNCAFE